MAKKNKWAPETPDSPYDAMWENVTTAAKTEFPGKIYSGGPEMMRVVCLPVPAFAVRFLFQQEGWPLNRFAMIVGEEETCKSSFGFEIMRWHCIHPGGGGVLIPTEPKDSPELMRSIIGYDGVNFKIHDKCSTTQEWNTALTWWTDRLKRHMDGDTKAKIKGVGRTFPVNLMIDSLVATLTISQYTAIEEKGTSSKHYAENAQLLDDYIKYITQAIDDYPISLIAINHLKPAKEKVGMFERTVRNIGGGKTPKFYQSTEIQMNRATGRAPGKDIDRVKDDERGIELEIGIHKNSNAPHEKISVDMLWYTDYEDRDPAGHYRQKTFFDWHSSSIEILDQLTRGDGKRAKRLREVIDVDVDKDTRRVASSALGIKAKEKIRYREAGEVLEKKLAEDKEFRDKLYSETGIRRRYLFRSGVDYQEQIAEAIKLATAADAASDDKAATNGDGSSPFDAPKEK